MLITKRLNLNARVAYRVTINATSDRIKASDRLIDCNISNHGPLIPVRPRFGTHRSAAYKVFGILFKHFGDLAMSHPVDDDPIMASAIGRCSNNWTHAESVLSWIFCHLTDTTPTVAVTVFSFFKATRTQRDVLRKLGKMTPFMTEDLNSRLKDALKTYIALAEERNELLHNPIGRSVENQVYIMLRKALPEPGALPYHTKPIMPTEIDDLSERIKNFNSQLRAVESGINDAKIGASRQARGAG